MYSGLRNDVGVESVAKIDGVDIVAFKVTIHNGKKHLEEQIDGIDQHGEEVQPRLARHRDGKPALLTAGERKGFVFMGQ
jgi:hypothetical protein